MTIHQLWSGGLQIRRGDRNSVETSGQFEMGFNVNL